MTTGFFEKAQEVQRNNDNITTTENGALAYRSTGKCLLDLNFCIPQMRRISDNGIQDRWEKVYEDVELHPELALRWLFFLRDIRGGIGERRAFQAILKWMTENYPDVVYSLIDIDDWIYESYGDLIPFYGRWDDLLSILGINEKVSKAIYAAITRQLINDRDNMLKGKGVSLLAKWLPTLTGGKASKKAARKLCKKLRIMETDYRKLISSLRRYMDVTEVKMSSNRWDEIEYDKVPSRASMLYSKAFYRHDEERYQKFIDDVKEGKKKINSSTLFPHEIVHKMRNLAFDLDRTTLVDSLEALWAALPNVTPDEGNTIVVRDGSGSMFDPVDVGRSSVIAMDVADALSIYFGERMTGEFHNKLISFSSRPVLIDLDNASSQKLNSKLSYLTRYCEVANTNIEAVFKLILQTAIEHHMRQDELPSNILIISDMEFDSCATDNDGQSIFRRKSLFDNIQELYKEHGYKIPRVIFWNVNSRSNAIPMTENDLGVTLISGFSVHLAKMVMSGKIDPWDCLVEQIMDPRYDLVSVALGYIDKEAL